MPIDLCWHSQDYYVYKNTISFGLPVWTPVTVFCFCNLNKYNYLIRNNIILKALLHVSGCCLHAMYVFATHLADAASLTEGADSAHVALVARAERWGMKGGRVQRDTRVGPHISFSGLQVVALAEQGQGVGIDTNA